MKYKKLHQVKCSLVFLILFISCLSYGQQKVVRLYEGKAPGSESWNWQEQSGEISGARTLYNIVEPTLTVYPAKGTTNIGTAVIIAPGGGLMALSINSEGTEVAEWLSARGVAAFVLKYRTAHINGDFMKVAGAVYSNPKKMDSLIGPVIQLAMNDGLGAVAYVRKNAATYGIKTDRIGFIGFSAGGGITMSVAYNAKEESSPNFIAPIYAWDKDIVPAAVPSQNMPAFIVVASDDPLQLVPTSIDIYNQWTAAKQRAELHIYQSGGHGFGMKKQNKPSDTWIERFGDWLKMNGWL